MQPFEKHPADPGALQAYGEDLINEGSQALQLGKSTRAAYSPAIPSVQGVPAPAVAAAPIPVDEASAGTSGALVWAAVATQYWGGEVQQFNTKVDQIVANLAAEENAIIARYDAQATPGAVPGGGQTPPGTTQNPQDTAEALERIGATMRAREEWQKAHDQHVVAGGARAKAMLEQGPTAENQRVARATGAMPDLEWEPFLSLAQRAGARYGLVTPDGQGIPGEAIYGVERGLNILAYGDTAWRFWNAPYSPRIGPFGQFQTQYVNQTPAEFKARHGFVDRWRAIQDPKNFKVTDPAKLATAERLTTAARWAKVGGPVVSAGSGAWDQWTRDAGRTDIGTAERAARAGGRGAATGVGAAGGAWAGAKVGMAIGAFTANPVGVAVGGLIGAAAGGIIGAWAGNEAADAALYPAGEEPAPNGSNPPSERSPGIGGV